MDKFNFKLRGATWTVKLCTEEEFLMECDLVKAPAEFAVGFTFYDKLTILVKSNQNIDAIKATLFHEVCHAWLGPTCGSKTDQESHSVDLETCCNLVGEGLLEILPQMKKWPSYLIPNWLTKK